MLKFRNESKKWKIYLILSVISFISTGILTAFYFLPPSFRNSINITGYANSVFVSDDFAYVSNSYNGLAIINVSNPLNPGTPLYVDTRDHSRDVFVSGDYVYVANSDSGLVIIDVSNPLNPGAPKYKDTTGRACGVFVSGDYAYVADGYSGLAIIDVSNPISPGTPIYKDTADYAHSVFVSGDYAYVTDRNSGLVIIDVSNPISPGTPIYKETIGRANDVFVSGGYAYVANSYSGLAIIDVSDPLNPGAPSYIDTRSDATDVIVSGDYAYVADNFGGMAIIDVSNPLNPGTPLYIDTTGYTRGVFVSGDYAYMAVGNVNGRLVIVNISDIYNEIALDDLKRTITLFGMPFSIMIGVIFILSLITGLENKNENIQTKPLWKRILIATINGIIGALIVRFNYMIWYFSGPSIIAVGPSIFVVNVLAALTWEKNENEKTKPDMLVFLSPVLKGVISGAFTGAFVMTIPKTGYIVMDMIDVFSGGVIGGIIGGVIGMIQMIQYSARVSKSGRYDQQRIHSGHS